MKSFTSEGQLKLAFICSIVFLFLNLHALATIQNDAYDNPNLITCQGRIKTVKTVPIKGYDFVSIRLECNGEEKLIWVAPKSYEI